MKTPRKGGQQCPGSLQGRPGAGQGGSWVLAGGGGVGRSPLCWHQGAVDWLDFLTTGWWVDATDVSEGRNAPWECPDMRQRGVKQCALSGQRSPQGLCFHPPFWGRYSRLPLAGESCDSRTSWCSWGHLSSLASTTVQSTENGITSLVSHCCL